MGTIIETGTTTTAVGKGVLRVENWTTEIGVDSSLISTTLATPTNSNFGYTVSRRMNFNTIYSTTGQAYIIPQGTTTTTRSVMMSCL